MRILLSNDDGIDAPGLQVLQKIARELSDDIWIVAPQNEQSGAGHSLTLHDPLRIHEYSDRKFAVRGTPTDCVMMALNYIITDKQPDLILSGVNRGGNLGEDVTYSGTVSAALEGTMLGVPSIALSQCMLRGSPVKWSTAEHHAPGIIRSLIETGWDHRNVLVNINFPDVLHDRVTGVEVVPQGRREATALIIDRRIDARELPYFWLGYRPEAAPPARDCDLGAIRAGAIAVTPLQIDMTHRETMKRLEKALS
ncbi:5'/3'-nucleotidase SurE [Oceanibacterium hippocampi]|uniref:5'-nucleotidase SurE n=1 Tax=Oceanibacterium hippocampi TaxID=745714 RepID=A0A1Y5TZ83_9PROT|nr:5'/3'-nucleotidase SurE [Oceanibacterium hippocampi]SLN77211.1 5'-nucleotidase SurE [Oceanibacterium hippocampi]